jgi:hypothetical protein
MAGQHQCRVDLIRPCRVGWTQCLENQALNTAKQLGTLRIDAPRLDPSDEAEAMALLAISFARTGRTDEAAKAAQRCLWALARVPWRLTAPDA